VVGVTTFQLKEGQSLNSSIPSNYVKPLLNAKSATPFRPIEPEATTVLQESKPAQDSAPFPSDWIRVQDGSVATGRLEGDYIYVKGRVAGDSDYLIDGEYNCELKKQGAQWAGKCWLQLHRGVKFRGLFDVTPSTCYVELGSIVTPLTHQRIERRVRGLLVEQIVRALSAGLSGRTSRTFPKNKPHSPR
jgi:hypothetical protein